MVKTKQAILVAEYSHPTQPGEATKIVEVSIPSLGHPPFPHGADPNGHLQELADYLIGVGY